MLFQDKSETFIFIDDKNKLIKFNKIWSKELEIITTEIKCTLVYTYEKTRNDDYNKLKEIYQKMKEVI